MSNNWFDNDEPDPERSSHRPEGDKTPFDRPIHRPVEDEEMDSPRPEWPFHAMEEPPVESLPEVEPTHEAAVELHGDFDGDYDNQDADTEMPSAAVVWLVCAVLGVLGGMIVAYVLSGRLPRFVPWWIPFGMGMLILLASMFYAQSTVKMQNKQRPTALQLAVPYNPRYVWVRPKDVYRIRHVLSVDQSMPEGSEQRIHIIFRFQRFYVVGICWLRALILVVYLFVTAWLSWTTDFEQKVPWWIIVGIPLVLALRLYIRYLAWRDLFFVMTDKNFILLIVHSPWLWWLKGRKPFLPVKEVKFAELIDTRAGNAFSYGTLVIDGFSKLDVAYNQLKFTPHHDIVGKFVMMLVNANKAEQA